MGCYGLGDKRLEMIIPQTHLSRISVVVLCLYGKWVGRWIDFYRNMKILYMGVDISPCTLYTKCEEAMDDSVRACSHKMWWYCFLILLELIKNKAQQCEVKNLLSLTCVETSNSSNYHIKSFPRHCSSFVWPPGSTFLSVYSLNILYLSMLGH